MRHSIKKDIVLMAMLGLSTLAFAPAALAQGTGKSVLDERTAETIASYENRWNAHHPGIKLEISINTGRYSDVADTENLTRSQQACIDQILSSVNQPLIRSRLDKLSVETVELFISPFAHDDDTASAKILSRKNAEVRVTDPLGRGTGWTSSNSARTYTDETYQWLRTVESTPYTKSFVYHQGELRLTSVSFVPLTREGCNKSDSCYSVVDGLTFNSPIGNIWRPVPSEFSALKEDSRAALAPDSALRPYVLRVLTDLAIETQKRFPLDIGESYLPLSAPESNQQDAGFSIGISKTANVARYRDERYMEIQAFIDANGAAVVPKFK